MVAPFELAWGAEVYAKVLATNIFGNSLTSEAGNGAELITSPDKPLTVAEIVSERSATSISIQWDDGVSSGGKPVLDYRVSYALETDLTFTVAEEQVTKIREWTISGLVAGSTYKFIVESRN
jgi:hypothetical protein